MMEILSIVGIVSGFMLFFVLLWLGVGKLTAWVGGWHHLAQKYQWESDFPIQFKSSISGTVGIVNYNYVLNVSVQSEGIYLGIMQFFRYTHPNLFLKWEAIEKVQKTNWLFLGTYYRFKIKDTAIWVRLHHKAFEGAEKWIDSKIFEKI